MAQLVVKQGPGAGKAYTLDAASISVGRDRSNGVCLVDETVSRAHARLERGADGWAIADLKSSNGTRVNGKNIERATVRHMDEIQLGDVTLIFMDDSPALLGAEDAPPEVTQVLEASTIEMLRVQGPAKAQGPPEEVQAGLIQLFRLSTDVGACRTVADLMAKVSASAAEALHADRVVPITLEPRGDLRPWYGRRSAANAVLAELPISTSVVNYVRRKRAAVLSEVQADDRFRASASVLRHQIATALCVPLLSGGRELGVIYADRIAPAEPFTRPDLEMLAAMAMPVVVALDNIRAAEGVRAERERLVDQMKLEHSILGGHASVAAVLELVERVAPTGSNVLIIGESGTGKELVARAIHLNSPRSGHSFEAVNCAALAPALLESELFGHVKGAFTGAIEDRPGRFELADKGTLFLDEIGEMPPDSQAKLLRVIEQGELRRVGDTKDRTVDVRILAATNKQLDRLAADGKFRDDLFYRLNIIRIELPPLRARGEDVDLLADHFLALFSAKCSRKPLALSVRARELLRRYAWPGNVRELKNVMERLAVVCRVDEVRPEDLPPEVCAGSARTAAASAGATVSLADVEREHIARVLAATGGNKKEAATVLGIDRSTLYTKLKQYGME